MNINILPSHILRLYAWELLKNNSSIWAPTNKVNGLVPIIPIEDEPKLLDSGKSYLIYGYSEQAPGKVNEIRRGNLSFRIIGRTFAELGEITNILARGLENCDVTAANINMWSSQFTLDGVNYPLIGIRFTEVEVTYIEGGSAPETEGGPSEGLINIGYSYVTHQDVKQYTPAGTWV